MTATDRQLQPPSRIKRIVFPLVTVVVVVVLGAAALELIAIGYLYARDGRYVSARTRFESRSNTFVQGLVSGRDCGYVDTMYPHPYLGFVHHGNPPCGMPNINNVGL